VRCARCGNENSDTNRFCGMCGATLLQGGTALPATAARPATPVAAPPSPGLSSAGPASPRPSSPVPARPPAPVSEPSPVITGPSFLGLNQPAPSPAANSAPRAGAGNRLSIDPNSAPSSRSLDYLLEDDEEPERSGAGKFILILVALALAAGFGYLRWRNQGFAWLGVSGAKPAAATQSSDNSSANSTAPAAAGSTAPPTPVASQPSAGTTQPAGNPPASGGSAAAPATPGSVAPGAVATGPAAGSAPASAGPTHSAAAPAASQPAANQPAASSQPPTSQPAPSQPSANRVPSVQPTSSQAPSSGSASSPSTSKPSSSAPPATDSDAATAPAVKPKPPAVVAPPKPVDPVAEAQKYIDGTGVPQNCDRGLRLLKPLAEHANPRAMIQMGALYSAGLCTPRDLPTAYRWFALALRKDPDNQSVQTDLEKLWGEMTQPERQLAIKLTQ